VTFQSVPECAEAVIEALVDTQPIANVLHFWRPGGYTLADLQALSVLVDNQVNTSYLDNVGAGVTYSQTSVRGLEFINDQTSSTSTGAGPGRDGTLTLPSNCSFCVTLRSVLTGRSSRGRFYAFPANQAILTADNTVSSTYANAIVDFLLNMRTDAGLAGWTMVIVSRFSNKVKRAAGVHFTVEQITHRNLIIDSQRGRLPQGH